MEIRYSGMDVDLEEFARQELDGDDYDSGVTEATERTASNNSEAIGRLLGVLANRGLLNAVDVYAVLTGYAPDDINDVELIQEG